MTVLSPARATTDENAEKLPTKAAKKFLTMTDELSTQRAIIRSLDERAADELSDAMGCERENSRLNREIAAREHRRHHEPRIKELLQKRDRHRAANERLKIEADKKRSRSEPLAQNVEACRALIAPLPAAAIRIAAVPEVPRGATVESIRADIERIDEETRHAEQAPRPRAEVIKAIEASVDAMAQRGRPKIRMRDQQGDPARLAEMLVVFQMGESVSARSAFDLIVWIMRDEIVERVSALVPPDGKNTLTDKQRDRKLADLAAHKLELERIEESLIESAEAEGRTIPRRPGADPRAILGIEVREGCK